MRLPIAQDLILIDTNVGLRFPYIRVITAVRFAAKDVVKVAMLPSISVELELNDSIKGNSSDLPDLSYPFDNMDVDNQLLVPNPIASSTLLPSDVPQPGLAIQEEELPREQPNLTQVVFSSAETDIESSSSSLPPHLSPLKSPQLQRSSPYSVNDPGWLVI